MKLKWINGLKNKTESGRMHVSDLKLFGPVILTQVCDGDRGLCGAAEALE